MIIFAFICVCIALLFIVLKGILKGFNVLFSNEYSIKQKVFWGCLEIPCFLVLFILFQLTQECANWPKQHEYYEDWEEPKIYEKIYIQPLNTYTEAEAEAIGQKLTEILTDDCTEVETKILPTVQLGDEFKNEAGTRYRADKILDWLKEESQGPVIALINDDISCTYKDRADWGVLGLSHLGRDVCVVSTYRVKNKQNFWKVVYHEFGHAHYGLPHCPADDPTCIMQDAKGHPRFGPKTKICDSCWHSIHTIK